MKIHKIHAREVLDSRGQPTIEVDVTFKNGTLGRNTFEGPGFANTDFSVFKNIKLPLGESTRLQFRAEFFNVFNRVNFRQPTVTLSSSTFGRATSTFTARQVQFGLKIIF